jgi:hypothetical protein
VSVGSGGIVSGGNFSINPVTGTNAASTGISVTTNVATTGSGSSDNIPPGIVGGMRFIKTWLILRPSRPTTGCCGMVQGKEEKVQ